MAGGEAQSAPSTAPQPTDLHWARKAMQHPRLTAAVALSLAVNLLVLLMLVRAPERYRATPSLPLAILRAPSSSIAVKQVAQPVSRATRLCVLPCAGQRFDEGELDKGQEAVWAQAQRSSAHTIRPEHTHTGVQELNSSGELSACCSYARARVVVRRALTAAGY